MITDSEILWAQKYRPRTVADCILPASLKKEAEGIVKKRKIPNMIFAGKPGIGKTTLALALADELEYETMVLNGSGADRGIDVVKDKILRFASTMSLEGNRKLIIYDEADNITQDAQLALRATIEQVSSNCSFILTCNYPGRLNEALLSRCDIVNFAALDSEKEMIQAKIAKRCYGILKSENVEFDPEALFIVVQQLYPDFRKTINRLQKLSNAGRIDASVVKDAVASNMDALVARMRSKNFRDTLLWVTETSSPPQAIFSWFCENGEKVFADDTSWAQCFIEANDHDAKAVTVADPKVNLVAFLLKLMSKCKFR